MPELKMPRLSDSMEEGTIVRWLRAEGDVVARGEAVVEIETDKATMEFEADEAGPLAILAGEGDSVPVGAVIAYIGERAAAANGHAKLNASPVARRLAASLGVDLASVAGSGRRSRILKADVRASAAAPPAPAVAPPGVAVPAVAASALAAPAVAPPDTARGEPAREPVSRLQAAVARRMSESQATVPDFWTSVDVDMTEVLALRARLQPLGDPVPSINDVIVAATARALRAHPRVNGSFRDGAFTLWERVNVGIAVATDAGLVVPTVFDADRASLGAIARATRRLAERVRAGAITPPELEGGTFTVSNLGMYGVGAFGGIVTPPQAGILCVGAAADRPWAVDGEVVVRPVATFTLVADHRILYGADAAAFVATLRDLLQDPLRILV